MTNEGGVFRKHFSKDEEGIFETTIFYFEPLLVLGRRGCALTTSCVLVPCVRVFSAKSNRRSKRHGMSSAIETWGHFPVADDLLLVDPEVLRQDLAERVSSDIGKVVTLAATQLRKTMALIAQRSDEEIVLEYLLERSTAGKSCGRSIFHVLRGLASRVGRQSAQRKAKHLSRSGGVVTLDGWLQSGSSGAKQKYENMGADEVNGGPDAGPSAAQEMDAPSPPSPLSGSIAEKKKKYKNTGADEVNFVPTDKAENTPAVSVAVSVRTRGQEGGRGQLHF